jgi:hypothetical protein
MKRQTLLQIMIFAGMFLLLLAVTSTIRFRADRAMAASGQQVVSLGELTLKIPQGFGAGRAYRDEAWEVREFQGGSLGSLRLATEPGDGTPWETLCARWFGMSAYPAEPIRFQVGGYDWFFKEVPVFGRGAYALRKWGKQVRFIAFFERGGVRYWMGLDTRDAFTPQKELFDGMVRSLRLPDGTGPGRELDGALRSIVPESRYRFVQPVEIILLIPAVAVVLISIIQCFVRWRGGRLPETLLSATKPPVFAEGGIEIGLARPFQRKFMDCAVVVTPDDLTVYTFGTPFLTVPRNGWNGRIELGRAWLGLPFVKLELEVPPVFHKWAKLYRGMRGPLTLRIYTRDAERLRMLLRGV